MFLVQTAIDTAIKLHHEINDIDFIDGVEIHTFNMAKKVAAGSQDSWQPTSEVGANHSLPYCVAVALLNGNITLESFGEPQRSDHRLKALLRKTKVMIDDDFNQQYPESLPCRILVSLLSGDKKAAEKQYPSGHPKNPMSVQRIEEKFFQWGGRNMKKQQLQKLLDLLDNIDQLEGLSGLCALLRLGDQAL